MKKQFSATVLTLVISVLLNAGVSQAQSRSQLQGKVPYDFWVGETQMPAGEYVIKTHNPQVLLIQSKDGRKSQFITTSPEIRKPLQIAEGDGVLVFTHVGSKAFLSKVENQSENYNRKLPVSSMEREMARNNRDAQLHRIALNRQ